ncbi:unnamed protein product [Symbiodinium necroappetens]|uniref:Uncharacterized protein n=2 Tax=Symbiodinium TaxID=2949 RepID=A0A813B476_9DINO|nr:hypothetical protein AK812_SmicGene38301 [Symbiodinium microadriaticum]CAE7657858.1 unnamed protein product [Symbiodinium microadriaticum]CAE7890029.1 unnamed protein product [Symbiodinium necroappetens]CAE7945424.1 unnamed protein product [Symbiodinium sp. KB8]
MTEQLEQAKVVVRDFVLEMRMGRRMMVLSPTGQLKATTCSLNSELCVLRITRASQVRRVWLKNIAGIYAGQEPEGLSTPLDDLCATIAIKPSGEMITFRLEHINARDTFVMCMMLFAQSQGAEMVGLSHEGPDEEDDGEDLVVEEARLSSAVGSQA